MDISCYSTRATVEIIMASIMVITIIGVFVRSYLNKSNGKGYGIGARVIQFTCVCLIIPAIIILSLEGIIKGETVATIIGGLIGYVLSGVGNYESDSKDRKEKKPTGLTSAPKIS